MKIKNPILILTYYHYPCREQVLENVFAKELGRIYHIVWLFQGDISNSKILKWHNSKVLLSRKIKEKNRWSKFINNLLQYQKLFQVIEVLRKEKINIVFVRDMPLIGFFIGALKIFFSFSQNLV